MLNELAVIVLIFKYPPLGAIILPERRIVDAVKEDVSICEVDTEFEKVALFAKMLDMLREPAGFVMMAEPSVNDVRVGASIVA